MRAALAPDVASRLKAALRRAGRREIGGMLFAEQLEAGSFRIVDFSVDDTAGTSVTFIRDPKAHQASLNAFFDRTGNNFSRFNYLGEWHSHPSFSVQPSLEDVETMNRLVENPSSTIAFALLLIVRLRFMFLIDQSMTAFVRGQPPYRVRPIIRLI